MSTYNVKITAEETVYYEAIFVVEADSETNAEELAEADFLFDPSMFEVYREVTDFSCECLNV